MTHPYFQMWSYNHCWWMCIDLGLWHVEILQYRCSEEVDFSTKSPVQHLSKLKCCVRLWGLEKRNPSVAGCVGNDRPCSVRACCCFGLIHPMANGRAYIGHIWNGQHLGPAQSLFCTQWCVLVTFEAQFVKPAKIFNIFEELILKTLSCFISSQFNFKYWLLQC